MAAGRTYYQDAVNSALKTIRSFPRFVWDVAKVWYNGGIGDLAAGVTFWILVTVPAAALTIVSSASFLDRIIGSGLDEEVRFAVLKFVNETFTTDADPVIVAVNALFDQPATEVLTVAAGFTLFTISRGFAGMIRALDSVYDVEDGRAWYVTRFVGLILGLGTVLVIIPIVLLEVLFWDAFQLPMEGSLRPLVSLGILVFWASMIFHYGPSTRSKWRWDLPGSLVAAVFWWALTIGYTKYIDVISLGSGASAVLGIIGAFLLALTWVWLASQVLLIGAAVNFVLGENLGLNRGKRRSVINKAIFNATGELKKVVVNGSRTDDTQEFSPKAVVQRLKPTNRVRSVLDDAASENIDLRESDHHQVG